MKNYRELQKEWLKNNKPKKYSQEEQKVVAYRGQLKSTKCVSTLNSTENDWLPQGGWPNEFTRY